MEKDLEDKALFRTFVAAALLLAPMAGFAADDDTKEEKNPWSVDYMFMDIRSYSSSGGFDMSRNVYMEAACVISCSTAPICVSATRPSATRNLKQQNSKPLSTTSTRTLPCRPTLTLMVMRWCRCNRFGLDNDSKYTYVKYEMPVIEGGNAYVMVYPFSFNSEFGHVFFHTDVNYAYSVEGAPNSINGEPTGSAKIVRRTMPGIELGFQMGDMLKAFVGGGAVRYYYPAAANFKVENGVGADIWEPRSDYGGKAGLKLHLTETSGTEVKAHATGHLNTEETGSLLSSVYSLIVNQNLMGVLLELEGCYSIAGQNPWNVEGSWFADSLPYRPVYSDKYGRKMDFIGQGDFAASLRVGYDLEFMVPYVQYRYLGANFIYHDNYYFAESSERLRTADKSVSHGGLQVVAAGIDFVTSNGVKVTPVFEYKYAANEVFAKTTDIRSDESLQTRQQTDIVASLQVNYNW
jgi:hypothetical protein